MEREGACAKRLRLRLCEATLLQWSIEMWRSYIMDIDKCDCKHLDLSMSICVVRLYSVIARPLNHSAMQRVAWARIDVYIMPRDDITGHCCNRFSSFLIRNNERCAVTMTIDCSSHILATFSRLRSLRKPIYIHR